jgi:hypothetical protein
VSLLRVGWIDYPIKITVLPSDLVPDLSAVTASRVRILHAADTQAGPGTVASATISNQTADSYDATYVTQTADVATANDVLRIYVESQVGGVWYSTERAVKVSVFGLNE